MQSICADVNGFAAAFERRTAADDPSVGLLKRIACIVLLLDFAFAAQPARAVPIGGVDTVVSRNRLNYESRRPVRNAFGLRRPTRPRFPRDGKLNGPRSTVVAQRGAQRAHEFGAGGMSVT